MILQVNKVLKLINFHKDFLKIKTIPYQNPFLTISRLETEIIQSIGWIHKNPFMLPNKLNYQKLQPNTMSTDNSLK